MPNDRSGERSKKRKNEPKDFKRVKAKVGKRALKPANETDTSFKTSRIGTTNNQFDARNATDNELLSSRGRSLDDLVSHFRHPAAAVRMSAARGLKDAITMHHVSNRTIRNHLATLVPVCAKGCVDEDSEVRQIALAILREIITRLCSSSDGTGGSDDHALESSAGHLHIKPFVPLLMAHAISALNSLDRKIQLDGVIIVSMLSSVINSLMVPYKPEILSAYVGILSDTSRHLRSSEFTIAPTKEKGGKNPTTVDSIKHQVLQSLVSLLKSDPSNAQAQVIDASIAGIGIEVKSCDGTINALFVPSCQKGSLRSLTPMSSLRKMSRTAFSPLGTNEEVLKPNTQTICDLLSNLRDAFAEATQTEKGSFNLQALQVIMKAAHLVYDSSCHSVAYGGKGKRIDPVLKAWARYTALFTALFPLSSEFHPENLVTNVNLEFCSTMLDTYLDGMDVDSGCLNNILVFLFAELKRCRLSVSSSHADGPLFGALEKLLLISKTKNDPWAQSISHRLIGEVAGNLFGDETALPGTETSTTLARSFAARKCVSLVKDFFEQHNWSIPDDLDAGARSILSQTLRGLATFMVAWGGDYLSETHDVITILHQVVRRLDATSKDISNEETCLLDHIRSSLAPLVKQKEGSISTFEAFPVAVQRKILGLIVVLKAPTQELLDGLARICGRCRRRRDSAVSPCIASLAAQSIHNVRRTISMQAYLGFIANSMGISGKPLRDSEKSIDGILQFDKSITLACQFLCQCGPSRVLPMLQPLLEGWLVLDDGAILTANKVLTARAAILILGSFSARIGNDFSILETVPNIRVAASRATCCILNHLYLLDEKGTGLDMKTSTLGAFLEPFIVLFQSDCESFLEVYYEVSQNIHATTVSCQTILASALLEMITDARLSSTLKRSQNLIDCTTLIEKALVSSSAQQLAGRLRAAVELLASDQPACSSNAQVSSGSTE